MAGFKVIVHESAHDRLQKGTCSHKWESGGTQDILVQVDWRNLFSAYGHMTSSIRHGVFYLTPYTAAFLYACNGCKRSQYNDNDTTSYEFK